MPKVARGNGADTVFSRTGSGRNCANPLNTTTFECSSTVFIGSIGIVRIGDRVAPHPARGCGPDNSVLTKASTNVFCENKGVGRLGDEYTPDNLITSGAPTVFCNGY